MLDKVVKDRPVFLRAYDGHTGWANTKALELAGVTKDTRDPDDGEIVRDKKRRPTGALKEGAQAVLDHVLPKPSREEKKAALKAAAEHCAALGLTAVDDIVYELDAFELYLELEAERALPLRVRVSPPLDPTELGASLETYAQWRDRLRDSQLVRFGFLKGFVDGVVESKTAYMLAPYHGSKSEVGRALLPKEKLFPLVDEASARGFQIALHAVGDAAVRLSLDAYEAANKAHPDVGVRHRVEHIEVLSPADAGRFAALDVVASMQPFHANPFGDDVEKGPWAANLGAERWDMTMPWRSLLSAKAALTFGSDWPVYTADPLHGLAVAVTRRDENGRPQKGWSPAQAVTIDEALAAYDVERGEHDGPSTTIGRLQAGQTGDVVVLDPSVKLDDPRTLWKGKASVVIVGGNVVVGATGAMFTGQ
jgi:predicted amidohydrolase YtcJ